MHIGFLLAAVFSTVILGSPVAEVQLPSLENFISFVPLDIAANPEQGTCVDALRSQSSNDQTFQKISQSLTNKLGPTLFFTWHLRQTAKKNISIRKLHTKGALFATKGNSVCWQGRNLSINSEIRISSHPPLSLSLNSLS